MKILKDMATALRGNYFNRRDRLYRKGIFGYFTNSRGYVIILVLIITTILISITADFIVTSQISINYMRKFDNRLKAGMLAKSGVKLGEYMLEADKKGLAAQMITGKETDKNIDSYDDLWAVDYPGIPIDDGTLKIKISDENSKINISAFANEFTEKTKYYYMAQIFFLNMGLTMDFADIMHDWVDIDDTPMPYGAETSDYYLTLNPSYSAKNGAMDSIDEMLMLKDMTPEIYYGLGGGNSGLEQNIVDNNRGDVTLDMDKVQALTESNTSSDNQKADSEMKDKEIGREKSRALPDYFRVNGKRDDFLHEYNKININTAPYRIISALTENMTDDKVSEVIRRRLIQPFRSINEIKEIIDDDDAFDILQKYITVKSYIFKIQATAAVGRTQVVITAIYNRDTKKILYWCEE